MKKVWVPCYQEGVPAEINPHAYPSLVTLLEQSFAEYGELPAFTCMGKTLSFAVLEALSRQMAAYFRHGLGLDKGDRLAIMMPNILQYPIALCAALRAGLTVVNVNPLYTARELEHQLKDSGAKAIVIVENFAHVLESVLTKTQIEHVVTTSLGELLGGAKGLLVDFVVKHLKKMVPAYHLPQAIRFSELLQKGSELSFAPPAITSEDLAFLQYTGGTTGVSKGAMLSHGNLVANVEQASAWLNNDIEKGREIIITALPLYHIFALTANCLTFMRFGGHNILIPNPRDISGFIKELKKYHFTAFTGVNTLFNALLNHPEFAHLHFCDLKLTLGGGMAVQKAVADRWQKVTGKPLVQAYGLTETSPAVCINPLSLQDFNGSIGLPIPSTEVSIRDDDNRELGFGEAGELCIYGPQVMKGYWQNPEETAKVFTADGWLKTGDMASMDEKGFVYIVDRKKDMILVSGFNVYPNEVEEVLVSHPGVLEAAVLGVRDEKSGEAVKAFVVKKDESLTSQEIIDFCRKQLTAYKVPKHVEFRSELPKTNVGKILRRALRET